MKNLFLFVAVLLTAFLLSCGNNNIELTNDNVNDEEGEREIQVLIPTCSSSGVVTGETVETQVGALHIKVLNSKDEIQWDKSYNDVYNGMDISGIPDVIGGKLIIMAYAPGNTNTPRWLGRATNVTFEKGVETKVSVLLYPIDGETVDGKDSSCLPQKMGVGRFGHTATTIADGRVLLVGGFVSSTDSGGNAKWTATDTVEILDPEVGTIQLLDVKLKQPRAMHTAFALPDGSVVLVGGIRAMTLVDTSVLGYPALPIDYENPVTSVERYSPSFPKYNLLVNGRGTQKAAKREIVLLDDPHFLTHQSYNVVKKSDNEFRVYIAGGLNKDLTPNTTVAALDISYDSTTEDVAVTITDIGEAEGALNPLLGGDATAVVTVGGRKFGATDIGQKLSPSVASWGASLTNIMGATQGYSDKGSYTFGGTGLSCTDEDTCSLSDIKTVYELFPNAAGERAGSLALTTVFADIAYIPAFDQFIIIGGARSLFSTYRNPIDGQPELQPGDAHVVMFKMPVNTLKGSGGEWFKRLNAPHLLSKTVVIGESTLLITGGVTSLKAGGETINNVEIITVK